VSRALRDRSMILAMVVIARLSRPAVAVSREQLREGSAPSNRNKK
jgi:hypothetical protein